MISILLFGINPNINVRSANQSKKDFTLMDITKAIVHKIAKNGQSL